MKFFTFYLCTFVVLFVRKCDGGSILFLPAMTSSSHKLALALWADALAERGHEVFWWAPATKLDKYQPKHKSIHVEHYEVDGDPVGMELFRYENSTFLADASWSDPGLFPSDEGYVNYMLIPFCESIMRDHKTSIEGVLSRKYDLVVIDEVFNNCGYLVSQLAKSPVASYDSACRTFSTTNRYNGVPMQYAYTPFMALKRQTDSMTFFQRLVSTVAWGLAHLGHELVWFPALTNSAKQYYPDVEPIQTSLMRPSLQFLCMMRQLDIIGPRMPNMVYMGGIQIPSDIKPLNEEYRSMVDAAKKGFIIFAMGHWANWKQAPEKIKRAIAGGLARVPPDYLVLWQYNGPPIPELPSHVKTVGWMPQRALLVDPKCKLFITHGGCNSFNEAVHFGVPMIALPLFGGDQYDDGVKIESMGFGFHLDKVTVTADELHGAIMKILQNKRYKEHVQKMSEMIRSDMMTPLQRTIFWSEFGMRHGRSDQLKSSRTAVFSSSLKYYCLDILIPVVVVLCVITLLLLKLSFAIWRFLSRRLS